NVGIGTTAPANELEVNGWYGRSANEIGGFVGGYNNVGANSTNSNPIYIIGSSYKPAATTLSNMYGVGYTHSNASFIPSAPGGAGWGMYVAADGDARIFLNGSTGGAYFAGNVGIGTTNPGAQLDLSTDSARKLTTTTWSTGSDFRIKTQVESISDALDIIDRVRPVKFHYTSDYMAKHPSIIDTDYYNFIAQEYQQVFPNSVTEIDGLLYLNSSNMIPYAIAGIKEQQGQIAILSAQLAGLSLTSTGEVQIIAQIPASGEIPAVPVYSLKNNNQVIDRIGAFSSLVVANIRAGSIETKTLVADSITLQGQSLKAYITSIVNEVLTDKTTTILSPIAQIDQLTVGAENTVRTEPTIIVHGSATISGELTAASIKSPTIDLIRQRIETISAKLNQATATATAPDSSTIDVNTLNTLYELLNAKNEATASAQSINIASIEASFGFFKDYLAVMGQTVTTDLTVTNNLNVATISSPNGILNLLAGLMILDQSGNVLINGNLTVNGEVLAQKVTAPQGHFDELLSQKLEVDEAKIKSLTTDSLIIASDASASAQTATSSASITTNATAGKAILPAGSTMLTINSPHITAETLIYVTPVGDSQNQVLYVKSKQVGAWFKVAINQALDHDLEFNWWIIKLEPERSI
ncbi:MAG: tail fiber domain-containing protein, partial [Patescibacteria group bacterium]|nr:tail fiber domain-containing protein [Patescibacteria group bacterium]